MLVATPNDGLLKASARSPNPVWLGAVAGMLCECEGISLIVNVWVFAPSFDPIVANMKGTPRD